MEIMKIDKITAIISFIFHFIMVYNLDENSNFAYYEMTGIMGATGLFFLGRVLIYKTKHK